MVIMETHELEHASLVKNVCVLVVQRVLFSMLILALLIVVTHKSSATVEMVIKVPTVTSVYQITMATQARSKVSVNHVSATITLITMYQIAVMVTLENVSNVYTTLKDLLVNIVAMATLVMQPNRIVAAVLAIQLVPMRQWESVTV